MDQNLNDSKSHIWNFFLENIISGIRAYKFFTFVRTFQWTSSEIWFSSRKSQSQKRISEKDHSFYNYSFAQKTSLILWTSTHLTLKIICSHNTAKNFSVFTNFSANMFLFGVRKSIFTATFFEGQKLHSCSILKANIFMFLCISLRKCLFKRHSKIFFWWGMGWGEAEEFPLWWLAVWAS